MCSPKSRVFDVQIVTVAPFCNSIRAMGFPTILLRPTTTACCPSIGIAHFSNNFIIPCGVQGGKIVSPVTSAPTL